ncbi:ABC transporter ATP-binding protein [Paenibacillus chartarius]|uniref:ABC transporter ATP-binding protein n=1 Tax=Paenibacillus chartarius TaxID=747481 RepID=A0ABV6DKT1_9BACL
MALLFPYIKKFHAISGFKLYLNFILMIIVAMFEGISIYLIMPMLSVTGVFDMDNSDIPVISWLTGIVSTIPASWQLIVLLVSYVVLVLGQALLQRYQIIINNTIQQAFFRTLRIETYEALLYANWSLYVRKRKSDINHMMTTELANVSIGTSQALRLGTSLVFSIIQICFAMWLSIKLTLFVMICGILLAFFSRRFLKDAKKLGSKTNKLSQEYLGGITEHFNGMKDIKSNRLEDQHLDWFQKLCRRMEHNYIDFVTLQSTSQMFYKVISAMLIAVFGYVSLTLFHAEVGQIAIIVIIFSRVWPSFSGFQASWEQIQTTIPAFKNVLEMLKECENSKDWVLGSRDSSPNTVNSGLELESLECRQVYYKYDSTLTSYALENINLRILGNQMTAIVGSSGAGKSTLIDLLIGLLKPERGQILINGVPLFEMNMSDYRNMIGFVSQDPFLFHTSIRENMQLVKPDASDEQMWEALKASASEGFVKKLPNGLDTIVGDRGIRLSGGERQRIVLARALLKKPAILILDEATSALDHENEAIVQDALERLKGKMTIIVIAHRLSTIRNADQVIVLENGRVIQQGGYQQLTNESNGAFSKMLRYQ